MICPSGSASCGWGESQCQACREWLAEQIRQFGRDRDLGRYDSEGYTPAERIAQQRKQKERGSGNGDE